MSLTKEEALAAAERAEKWPKGKGFCWSRRANEENNLQFLRALSYDHALARFG